MIIKREFILEEEDIKEAIKDWLSTECDDSDRLNIEFKLIASDTGNSGITFNAVCKEEIGNA